MTLYLIGIGLNDEKDISLKGLEAIKTCGIIYLETYTSKLNCPITQLEKLYKKKIISADRKTIEEHAIELFIKPAKEQNIALLIIGDVFSATTHIDIYNQAKLTKVDIQVIPNASVLTAIGITGLQLYKFGKTTSIPFPQKSFFPITPYTVLQQNQKQGLHTLFLLDLNPKENQYMTGAQAIDNLLAIENKEKNKIITKDTKAVICAQLGSAIPIVKVGTSDQLTKNKITKYPQCLIIPGKLHFIEQEALDSWK